MTRTIYALILGGLTLSGAQARPEPLYRLATSQPGPEGGYDYVSVDDRGDRVFIGRDFGVMTLDTATGRTATLLPRKGVAAVLPIPNTRLMLSTNGALDTATLFDRDTGAVTADIPTGDDPDGAVYDRATAHAFVMNGESGDVTMIDLKRAKAVATIKVGGTPEGAASDGKGHLFINVLEEAHVAVIDIARRKVTSRFPLAGCIEPTGLAYDPQSNTVIAACKNGLAALLDATSGRSRGHLPIGQRADGALFDVASRTGFVPALDGTLTIYRLDERGRASVLQVLKTREGARTAAYDAARDRLFLPFAKVERDVAGGYVRAAKDFGVLTVDRETVP